MVDTSLDCHLSYEPLGKTTPLSSLHFVQPRCPPAVYPTKQSAFLLKPDHSHVRSSWVILLAMASQQWIHIHLLHLTLRPLPHLTLLVNLTFLLVLLPSCQHRLRMILPNWFIARILLFHLFALVIGLTVPTQRPIGPPKNFIGLWDVIVFGIMITSSKPALTVNGLMMASFHWPLGLILRSQVHQRGHY
jgi:hypothetical protein